MTHAIAIVGTGRVAGALASLLHERGVPVAAMAGRCRCATQQTAQLAEAPACSISEVAAAASQIVIAVKDDAIASVAEELLTGAVSPSVVVHTSGSAGPEALKALRRRGTAIGVLHPLQTIADAESGRAALPGSSWAYAGDVAAENFCTELITAVSGHPLYIAREKWSFYHAAAVMASNYQVALADAALELMQGAGVPQEKALRALTPLITQASRNIVTKGPAGALTGPIQRGDASTVLRHLQALRAATPEIRNLYAAAGWQTLSLAARTGLDPVAASDVAGALAQANTQ